MWRSLAAAALAPLWLAQGLVTRRRTVRLPEAAGRRSGSTGRGTPLRVLLIGDSSAAGVGAEHQRHALAGRLHQALARHHRVHWRLFARTGWSTRDVLGERARLPPERVDVVTIVLGVNDVTSGSTTARFRANVHALIETLRGRVAPRLIVLSGLPPMGSFPALPQPLRWVMGSRAARFDDELKRIAGEHADCAHMALSQLPLLDPRHMASDGFHPGPEIYRMWAEALADTIRDRLPGNPPRTVRRRRATAANPSRR